MEIMSLCHFIVAVFLSSDNFKPFVCDTASGEAPIVQPWKSFEPDPAFHGQFLVAGDLDGDGKAEIVTARNDNQRVTAVIACKLDGKVLWKWGEANAGGVGIAYDIPLQTYDLDGDGKSEVWLGIRGFILVLDGATGKEMKRLDLPAGLEVADCITFADLTGAGRATDIIIKDRYRRIWAYTRDWKFLWDWTPTTYPLLCHHPTPVDFDGDGRDEVIAGYTMLDDCGREMWHFKPEKIKIGRGHLDCSRVMTTGNKPEDFRLLFSCCGDNGIAMVDGNGKTLWELSGHHFESIDTSKFRGDLPGKQVFVDIDHLPFGKCLMWLLDDKGNLLGEFKCFYGRHHRVIDWNGDGVDEMLFANARRLYDGNGKCMAEFGPREDFGHATGEQQNNDPGPFAVAADLDGDKRPEIILHSTKKVWVYKGANVSAVPDAPVGTVNWTYY
ncbi:MAG TPA: hypothetical protein PL033_13075 [Candidatus Brocadiia bacterium]|nr:hypothetical protein [Candidatus Brocadiia bacterium]